MGHILVEEADKEDQRDAVKLDLSDEGSLARHIEAELIRATESRKRWKELMKDSMPEQLPFERQLGRVHLESLDRTKEVHLSFDEYELAPNVDQLQFGNYLSIVSEEERRGEELTELAVSVLKRMFDNDLFDHGFCCMAAQYDAKNLDCSGGGVRAVGLDASKCLPGFYWGNYFGSYLCEVIGESVLLDVPGGRSIQLQSGVLVINELSLDSWSESSFIKNENLGMDHIGRRFFFDKSKASDAELFTGENGDKPAL